MHRLYANIMPLYMRDLSTHRLWYPRGPGINTPEIQRGRSIYGNSHAKLIKEILNKECMGKREIKIQRSGKKWPLCIPETSLLQRSFKTLCVRENSSLKVYFKKHQFYETLTGISGEMSNVKIKINKVRLFRALSLQM